MYAAFLFIAALLLKRQSSFVPRCQVRLVAKGVEQDWRTEHELASSEILQSLLDQTVSTFRKGSRSAGSRAGPSISAAAVHRAATEG